MNRVVTTSWIVAENSASSHNYAFFAIFSFFFISFLWWTLPSVFKIIRHKVFTQKSTAIGTHFVHDAIRDRRWFSQRLFIFHFLNHIRVGTCDFHRHFCKSVKISSDWRMKVKKLAIKFNLWNHVLTNICMYANSKKKKKK